MIIVDLHQTMISNMMMQLGMNSGAMEPNLFKHMVLNSIRSYKSKFSAEYGELVIATDTGASWRRKSFPYYKANRKKDREESSIDWSGILEVLHDVKDDLEEYFPYRIIRIEGAEADDIIGTLCSTFGNDLDYGDKILILSGDKDFKQLQKYGNVKQYDPTRNRWLRESDPEAFLIEHIIKGDKGDGVPNILSADNCLTIGQRQGTVTKKRLEKYTECAKTGVWDEDNVKRNFIRNTEMIDLERTPKALQTEIIESYNSQENKPRNKIMTYLMKNRMRHLMENLNDF